MHHHAKAGNGKSAPNINAGAVAVGVQVTDKQRSKQGGRARAARGRDVDYHRAGITKGNADRLTGCNRKGDRKSRRGGVIFYHGLIICPYNQNEG